MEPVFLLFLKDQQETDGNSNYKITEEDNSIKYGGVKITTDKDGKLYIDDKFVKEINKDKMITISNIKTGKHKIKIDYGNTSESREVDISENNILQVKFKYLISEKVNENYENLIIKKNDLDQIKFGEYIISNNVHGKGSIVNYKQSIFYDREKNVFGWEWDWPHVSEDGKSFPDVFYGKNPWYNFSTTDKLPVSVNNIDLKIKYDINFETNGLASNAFNIWITNNSISSQKDIAALLKIYIINPFKLSNDNSLDKIVKIDNKSYRLWVKNDFYVSSIKYKYICLIDLSQEFKGQINLKSIIDCLMDEKVIYDYYFISDIEFGNDVVYGTGKTMVNKFEIK